MGRRLVPLFITVILSAGSINAQNPLPPVYEYDFYKAGTTTVAASFRFPGFVRDISPASYPFPGFTGFISPSPASLNPCDLTSNSSAELDCRPPTAHGGIFYFVFDFGAFPNKLGAFTGSGFIAPDGTTPGLGTVNLLNGQVFLLPPPTATFLFDAVPGTGPTLVTQTSRWVPDHVCPENTCQDNVGSPGGAWYGTTEGSITAPAGMTFSSTTLSYPDTKGLEVRANDAFVRDYMFVNAPNATSVHIKFLSAQDPPTFPFGGCPLCVVVIKTGGIQTAGTITWTDGVGGFAMDTVQFRDQQP